MENKPSGGRFLVALLAFALTDWPYPGQRFGLTLRIGESYTNVFVEFLS